MTGTTTGTTGSSVRDPISSDLKAALRALKLGKMLDTLPERLALAKQQHLAHADFLELVLADEVSRRETGSAALRARAAGLEAGMRLDTWDDSAAISYDRQLWSELTTLRFVDGGNGALILGPVGTGKTHLATALGHIAVRRRYSTLMARADKLFKRLKAARLDNSVETEMRRLAHVQLLIIDDFALKGLDQIETADFYELVVERHRKAATVVTSNREPGEWLAMMADPLLAQSAVDRLASAAHVLIVEGQSYRMRQRPTIQSDDDPATGALTGTNRGRSL
jgi:DNA replication protein DnaC